MFSARERRNRVGSVVSGPMHQTHLYLLRAPSQRYPYYTVPNSLNRIHPELIITGRTGAYNLAGLRRKIASAMKEEVEAAAQQQICPVRAFLMRLFRLGLVTATIVVLALFSDDSRGSHRLHFYT